MPFSEFYEKSFSFDIQESTKTATLRAVFLFYKIIFRDY